MQVNILVKVFKLHDCYYQYYYCCCRRRCRCSRCFHYHHHHNHRISSSDNTCSTLWGKKTAPFYFCNNFVKSFSIRI